MEKIFSRVNGKLLHILYQIEDFKNINNSRVDLCDNENALQIAALHFNDGKTFKPHKHILNERNIDITQETWIVVSGSVKVFYYDVDDSLLYEKILNCGDITITLYGGHTYQIMSENTFVYEIKNGPYLGRQQDKIEI